jgi:hypothetical protein
MQLLEDDLATTLTYSLNGSYAEDSNSGPSPVPPWWDEDWRT